VTSPLSVQNSKYRRTFKAWSCIFHASQQKLSADCEWAWRTEDGYKGKIIPTQQKTHLDEKQKTKMQIIYLSLFISNLTCADVCCALAHEDKIVQSLIHTCVSLSQKKIDAVYAKTIYNTYFYHPLIRSWINLKHTIWFLKPLGLLYLILKHV
jgi:hypothetical protein